MALLCSPLGGQGVGGLTLSMKDKEGAVRGSLAGDQEVAVGSRKV